MKPSTRLFWVAVIIVGSAMYAVFVSWDRQATIVVTLGYIAIVLTLFVINEVWKKPHDRS